MPDRKPVKIAALAGLRTPTCVAPRFCQTGQSHSAASCHKNRDSPGPGVWPSGSVGADLHLQGAEHAGDGFFLLADEGHVVEHDGPAVVAGLDNQPAGLQEHVLEDVVDLFFQPQAGGGDPLQVAEEAVMVQQFVGRTSQ